MKAWFLTPRTVPQFAWPEAVVFLLYCVVLLIAIPFHEPWSDEAQAWLLARDCSLGQLFFHYLHYEGTPGLWHLILWVAIRLHLPYTSLLYISGTLAAAGVYVWLRYTPFPRFFRYLLPFTFYLQYQYAVIARNYVLFALSVFLLALLYTKRKPQPVAFAIVAGLTANESMHGALFAAGMFVAYLFEQRYRRKYGTGLVANGTRLLFAAVILVLCGTFAFWTAFPAPDNSNPLNAESVISKPSVLQLRAKITGIPVAPPSEPSPILAAMPPTGKGPVRMSGRDSLMMKVRLADALLTYPVSTSFALAYLFLLSAAVFILLYAGVRGLLPYAFLLPPMVFIHTADHHAGLPFVTLLGGLWMAWYARANSKRQILWADAAFSALFTVVVLLQIVWTVRAIHTDHLLPYDPGQETARYLKEHAAGKTIVSADFMTTSMQPYFSGSPFINHPDAFWTWSTRQGPLEYPERINALHPDMVVMALTRPEAEFLGNSVFPGSKPFVEGPFFLSASESWIARHFRETHRFCADELGRSGIVAQRCDVILERP